MPRCVHCGQEIDLEVKLSRRDDCPSCHRDLHACVQCKHYDRSAHNQCREPQSEWVADKEKANFCGFFEFGREVDDERAVQDDAKKRLAELFKGK